MRAACYTPPPHLHTCWDYYLQQYSFLIMREGGGKERGGGGGGIRRGDREGVKE